MLMYDAIEKIDVSLEVARPPKYCYLTTMTFVATLSSSDLKITPQMIEDLGTYAASDEYFTSIGPSAFSSSTIELHSTSMPSVRTKLFNKGSLQITGCKSHVQVMQSISEVCRVLSEYLETTVEALTMVVALINANIGIHDGINLTRFAQAARERGILAEQPERPPSCILKMASTLPGKTVTVLVYKPGKFTICAASPEDVAAAYSTVMSILDRGALDPKTSDALRKARGHYIWTQLVQCGMPGILHTHPVTTKHTVTGCIYCEKYGNFFKN